jgi:hypothetical protein
MESKGISFERLGKGKRKALDSMKVPNLENAKVIYSYLLEFKKAFAGKII